MKEIFLAAAIPLMVAKIVSGVVIYAPNGCGDRYVVETRMGLTILQWFGGPPPIEGQVISGEIESYGMRSLTLANGRTGKAWVEDYWLSTERAREEMAKFCA